MTATADQSCGKVLRMRPHFPFAEQWIASETERLFPCYPQWWPRCISQSPAYCM